MRNKLLMVYDAPKRRKQNYKRIILGVILLFVIIATVFPIAWVVSTSLKDRAETFNIPPTLIPEKIHWQNYLIIWETQPFARYFLNSIILAVGTCFFGLIIANLAAYGFSRFYLRLHSQMLTTILITKMVPSVLLIIPYFLMMSKLGLLNSYLALIIAYISFALPFCTWLLKGYYDSIPKEIDEAALIDGCSQFQLLTKVIFPLTLPGNIATLIFAFLQSWNEFLFALSLAKDQTMFTIPVGISLFIGEYRVAWNEIMATAVVASLPTVLLYILVDKYLVHGLAEGAVKM